MVNKEFPLKNVATSAGCLVDAVGNDPAVIQVKDGAEVDLVDIRTGVILELRHIRKPFLVRSIRVEVPVQVVPCDVCRVLAVYRAALWFPLDG